MTTEQNIKIREKSYIAKDGTTKIDKTIKFNDLGLDCHIIIEKIYPKTIEITGTKDGKPFVVNKTGVKYKDTQVNIIISTSSLEKWLALPLGKVKVSKVEFERDGQVRHTYNYEAV